MLGNVIAPIFAYSVADDAMYEKFKAVLSMLGATLEHLDETAAVRPRSGEQIVLAIPREAFDYYMRWRYVGNAPVPGDPMLVVAAVNVGNAREVIVHSGPPIPAYQHAAGHSRK